MRDCTIFTGVHNRPVCKETSRTFLFIQIDLRMIVVHTHNNFRILDAAIKVLFIPLNLFLLGKDNIWEKEEREQNAHERIYEAG